MVVALVSLAGWWPLAANVVGWLVAFLVSFLGHHRLSFRGHGKPWQHTMPRFLLVSAMGFAINEASYAAALHWSGLRYDLVLLAVLLLVAAATYWLGRSWAFARPHAARE